MAAFKDNIRSFSFDDVVPYYGVTSRAIVKALQRAVHEIGVPHPLHVHCNNLGLPGNFETALATIAAAEDLPLHLAHLQFYGYGKEGPQGFSSAAPQLAEAVNAAKSVTIDVGQVMFGQTVTISSDVLRQFSARGQARPKKYAILDGDANGFGVVPYEYRAGSFHNAVQFAVGLELFLLIDDPWRVFFTTDHPNGAPFTTYPDIFALLMDKDVRAQWASRLPAEALAVTTLPSLTREYTLSEIATMTRAAPAKLLGLPDRGHLGAGARADVALYRPGKDIAQMFRAAARVYKDGELVVRDGEVTRYRYGRALHVTPAVEASMRRRMTRILRRALRPAVRLHARARRRHRAAATLRGRRMRELTVNGVAIDDTFAEAFDMRATAIVITAPTERWAAQAAETMTGFATSVIGCGCEASVESVRSPQQTPDGRPGVRVLMFAVSTAELQKQLQNRVGQCVLTSPGSACYAGIEAGEDKLKLGDAVRFFGDGWQIAKRLGARRYWRVPVMDGEFVCESTTYLTKKAVGGGNLIVMGESPAKTLAATEAAVKAMREVADVIMPFPGGIARSGSKVGSKYKGASASTNDLYCPTLKGAVDSALTPEIGSVLEIVIDGLTSEAVAEAMRAGLAAIVELGPGTWRVRASAPAITAASSAGITIISRISSLEPDDLFAARAAGPAARSVGAHPAKSRRQDGCGNRAHRGGNDARAGRGGRRVPHSRGRSRRNCHRRRQRAVRSRRHGAKRRLDPRRRGGRRGSRPPDVGRTIDHWRRRRPVRGFRNEGRNAHNRGRRRRTARGSLERRDGRHERRRLACARRRGRTRRRPAAAGRHSDRGPAQAPMPAAG